MRETATTATSPLTPLDSRKTGRLSTDRSLSCSIGDDKYRDGKINSLTFCKICQQNRGIQTGISPQAFLIGHKRDCLTALNFCFKRLSTKQFLSGQMFSLVSSLKRRFSANFPFSWIRFVENGKAKNTFKQILTADFCERARSIFPAILIRWCGFSWASLLA